MTTEVMDMMAEFFRELDVPYEFMEWTDDVPSTYWIGQYNEIETDSEAGLEETNFFLTGTTNKDYFELESVKNRIKDEIGNGLTAILDDGSGVALLYVTSFPVPSAEFGVYRLQITLRIKEWKV